MRAEAGRRFNVTLDVTHLGGSLPHLPRPSPN